jgi:hypothetical protein
VQLTSLLRHLLRFSWYAVIAVSGAYFPAAPEAAVTGGEIKGEAAAAIAREEPPPNSLPTEVTVQTHNGKVGMHFS